MKLTPSKKDKRLSDIDVTINKKRIVRKGLTKGEVDEILTEYRYNKVKRKNTAYCWADAFKDCKEERWQYNTSTYSERFADQILTDLDLWNTHPASTDLNVIRDYVGNLKAVPLGQSKNKWLTAIKVMFKVAKDLGKVEAVPYIMPFKGVKAKSYVKFQKNERRGIDHEAVIHEWIQANCSMEERGFFEVLHDYGCRPVDALKLTWGCIEDDSIYFESTKDGDERFLPLLDIPWLKHEDNYNRDKDEFIFPRIATVSGAYRRIWDKCMKETKLKGLGYVPYSHRPTTITELLLTHTPAKVQKWAGHKKVTTTMIYAQLDKDALSDMKRN